ncbi:rootletin-like [Cyanistes caeruleus]|uniref:rootletin-like n=1 Tax=Cyanistes caeruleus TaxID=156563 RepID=UPI000CDAE84A|nr:rootletin-like [Cyanistes caeruleus]
MPAAHQQQNLPWLALCLQRLMGRQRITIPPVLSVQGLSILNQPQDQSFLPVRTPRAGQERQSGSRGWIEHQEPWSSACPHAIADPRCLELQTGLQASWSPCKPWKELAAFEGKRHSSPDRAFEAAPETAEESQPQRDLLKEEVPLAVTKVCRSQRPAHRTLEKLLQEFSRQGHTLSQVCKEKAVLAEENAALQARLAATERDLRGLLEQLAEARTEKESLQCSLLEALQQVSELEITRSRLEGQVGTAMQAKELILEDVRGLRCELQAVRSFSKQQCEEMAQQLRLAEEQFSKALRLWQSAQEEEKRKLLQKQVGSNTHLNFSGKLGGLA